MKSETSGLIMRLKIERLVNYNPATRPGNRRWASLVVHGNLESHNN